MKISGKLKPFRKYNRKSATWGFFYTRLSTFIKCTWVILATVVIKITWKRTWDYVSMDKQDVTSFTNSFDLSLGWYLCNKLYTQIQNPHLLPGLHLLLFSKKRKDRLTSHGWSWPSAERKIPVIKITTISLNCFAHRQELVQFCKKIREDLFFKKFNSNT